LERPDHLRIEAMKLAYSDLRAAMMPTRNSPNVPVNNLLSKDYAQRRAQLIDAHKANCGWRRASLWPADTTYLSVVDRDGNMVSWIQSVSQAFGSGVVVDGMGFMLQDRGFRIRARAGSS